MKRWLWERWVRGQCKAAMQLHVRAGGRMAVHWLDGNQTVMQRMPPLLSLAFARWGAAVLQVQGSCGLVFAVCTCTVRYPAIHAYTSEANLHVRRQSCIFINARASTTHKDKHQLHTSTATRIQTALRG